MVAKLLVLVALISTGMACNCANNLGDNVEAFQPAQALDIFKGFLNGVGQNVCAETNCYYNATYTITQVQVAINQLEYLINNIDNLDYQILLKFICGGLTIDFGDIYRICDVANLLKSYEIFTTTAGLEQVAKNFLYQIGVFKDVYEALSVCDSNFLNCGFNIGMGWRVLSGYGMPNVTLAYEPEFT